jgi:hypothetical protein
MDPISRTNEPGRHGEERQRRRHPEARAIGERVMRTVFNATLNRSERR